MGDAVITNDSLKNRRKGGSFLRKKAFKRLLIVVLSLALVISIACVSTLSAAAYTAKVYSLTAYDLVNMLDKNLGCYVEQYGYDSNGNWVTDIFRPKIDSSTFKLYPLNYTAEEYFQQPFASIFPNFLEQTRGMTGGHSSFAFNIGDTGANWGIYNADELSNCRYLSLYFDVFFQFLQLENNTFEDFGDYSSVLSQFPSKYITPALMVTTPDFQEYLIYSHTNESTGSSIRFNHTDTCGYYTFDVRFTPEQIEHMTPGTTFYFVFQWTGKPNYYHDLVFGFDVDNCFYEYTTDYNEDPSGEIPPGDGGFDNQYYDDMLNKNQQAIDDMKNKLNIVGTPDGVGMSDSFVNGIGDSYSRLTRNFKNSTFYSFLTTLCVPAVSIGLLGFVLYGKSK